MRLMWTDQVMFMCCLVVNVRYLHCQVQSRVQPVHTWPQGIEGMSEGLGGPRWEGVLAKEFLDLFTPEEWAW